MSYRRPTLVDGCVFFLLFSGPPKFRVREATASIGAEMDLVVMVHLLVWMLGAAWVCVRFFPIILEREYAPTLHPPALIGLTLLGLLSISIVRSPSIPLSAFVIVQLVIMCLFALLFVHRYGPEITLTFLFRGHVAMVAVIAVLWLMVPDYVTSHGRLFGTLITPVTVVVTLALTQLLGGFPSHRRSAFLAFLALCLVIVIAAQSRTAYVTLVAVLCLGWVFRPSAPVRSSLYYVLSFVGIAVAAGLIEVLTQFVIREQDTLSTMSQRIPLWEFLLSIMWEESPIFGLGFYAASRVFGPLFNSNLGTAHSSFVEILIGGGISSGIAYLALWISLSVYAAKLLLRRNLTALEFTPCALALGLFVFSLTGVMGVLAGPGGFTFWMVVALLPQIAARREAPANDPAAKPHGPPSHPLASTPPPEYPYPAYRTGVHRRPVDR